ncbi:hypothetical protein SAMN05444285_13819 [Draconibacterium orientale]|uniref:Uncharacterized protein n=1 Tax=Draconibacterium orientale TaxID=1168034 RepID=A0A1I0J6J1_9BACT|nr:hypothetical protein SAMN05444285_13819 [Draconibacterium orientale]
MCHPEHSEGSVTIKRLTIISANQYNQRYQRSNKIASDGKLALKLREPTHFYWE